MSQGVVFAQKLRKYIDDNFASLREFALVTGISESSVHSYIHGHRKPGYGALSSIKGCGCSLDWLFDGTAPIAPAQTHSRASVSLSQGYLSVGQLKKFLQHDGFSIRELADHIGVSAKKFYNFGYKQPVPPRYIDRIVLFFRSEGCSTRAVSIEQMVYGAARVSE